MKLIITVLLALLLTGTGNMRWVSLGFGQITIALPSIASIEKTKGFESDVYYVKDRLTKKQLLLIYVGSNWGQRALGVESTQKLAGLEAHVTRFGTNATFSKMVVVALPKHSPDRQLVFYYSRLSASKRRVADTIIRSLAVKQCGE